MKENKVQENLGVIKISEETVVTLITNVLLISDDIHDLSSSFAGNISNIIGKTSGSKGVNVAITENDVNVDIYIIVNYGVNIPKIAWKLQESIKKEIENMTSYSVKSVNIHVQGVAFAESGGKNT